MESLPPELLVVIVRRVTGGCPVRAWALFCTNRAFRRAVNTAFPYHKRRWVCKDCSHHIGSLPATFQQVYAVVPRPLISLTNVVVYIDAVDEVCGKLVLTNCMLIGRTQEVVWPCKELWMKKIIIYSRKDAFFTVHPKCLENLIAHKASFQVFRFEQCTTLRTVFLNDCIYCTDLHIHPSRFFTALQTFPSFVPYCCLSGARVTYTDSHVTRKPKHSSNILIHQCRYFPQQGNVFQRSFRRWYKHIYEWPRFRHVDVRDEDRSDVDALFAWIKEIESDFLLC